jgi:hypothetical protein
MKMTPELLQATQAMQPGKISKSGFFGDDPRDLPTLINDQRATCRRLGVSWEAMGKVLASFAEQASKGFGCTLTLDEKWEVCADEHRGKVPCPFPHSGMFQKTVYSVKNLQTGKTIVFTPLSIHLIKKHGFFQGRGAPFYCDPAQIVKVLEMVRS